MQRENSDSAARITSQDELKPEEDEENSTRHDDLRGTLKTYEPPRVTK